MDEGALVACERTRSNRSKELEVDTAERMIRWALGLRTGWRPRTWLLPRWSLRIEVGVKVFGHPRCILVSHESDFFFIEIFVSPSSPTTTLPANPFFSFGNPSAP